MCPALPPHAAVWRQDCGAKVTLEVLIKLLKYEKDQFPKRFPKQNVLQKYLESGFLTSELLTSSEAIKVLRSPKVC